MGNDSGTPLCENSVSKDMVGMVVSVQENKSFETVLPNSSQNLASGPVVETRVNDDAGILAHDKPLVRTVRVENIVTAPNTCPRVLPDVDELHCTCTAD